MPSPERIYAICANICRICHCLPGDIGDLTERQIYSVLFHQQESDGSIPIPDGGIGLTMPPGPPTLNQELALLAMLLAMPGAKKKKPEQVEAMREKLKAAHAKKATQPAPEKAKKKA